MKDTGIDKASLKEIETDSPIFKGFQSIRKLFWKYLNLLGVPFNDPCCPTASTATGGLGYLVYTVLLEQTGTNAPVATVLQNTLGGTVVWSRNGVGDYNATLTGAFTENKTYIPPFDKNGSVVVVPVQVFNGIVYKKFTMGWQNVNAIYLLFSDETDTPIEMSSAIGTLLSLPEIRVYL